MPAKVVTLCESIVSYLNNQTFSQSFTATRNNVWYTALEDTDALQVAAVPQEIETTSETRQSSQRRYRVLVLIQKRMTSGDDQADQDEMLELTEEIETALYGENMGEFGFDTFNETAGARQVFELEAMAQQRMFRTVLQISYLGA